MPSRLYILVRTDMDSLGRGKSVAQGAHAANQFTWDTIMKPAIAGDPVDPDVLEWSHEAKYPDGSPMGFGTTIALDASLKQMETAVQIAQALGLRASLVVDPEYPLLDGKTLHLLPNVVTTAYVFGDVEITRLVLNAFNLLANDPV
jgi:peptidyl-tRNA hydrolase